MAKKNTPGCTCCNPSCEYCSRPFSDALDDGTTISNIGDAATKCYLEEKLGDWRIVSGKLEVVTPTTEAILSNTAASWISGGMSGNIECNIEFTAASQKPGLLMFYADSNNWSAVYFTEGTTTITQVNVVAGSRTETTSPGPVTFSSGSTYNFKWRAEAYGPCPSGTNSATYFSGCPGDTTIAYAFRPSILFIDGTYACAFGPPTTTGGAETYGGMYLKSSTATSPKWSGYIQNRPNGTDCKLAADCAGCCACEDYPLYLNVDLSTITPGIHADLICDQTEIFDALTRNFCLTDIVESGVYNNVYEGSAQPRCMWALWLCLDPITGTRNAVNYRVVGRCVDAPYEWPVDDPPSTPYYCWHLNFMITAHRIYDHEIQRCKWAFCITATLQLVRCDPDSNCAGNNVATLASVTARYVDETGDTGKECGLRDPVTLTQVWNEQFVRDPDHPFDGFLEDDAFITLPTTIELTPSDTPCGDCDPSTYDCTPPPPPACDGVPCTLTCPDPYTEWVTATDCTQPDCLCTHDSGGRYAQEGGPCTGYCDQPCWLYLGQSDDPLGLGRGFNNYWHDDTLCSDIPGNPAECECFVLDSQGIWKHGDIAHVNASAIHGDEVTVEGQCLTGVVSGSLSGTCVAQPGGGGFIGGGFMLSRDHLTATAKAAKARDADEGPGKQFYRLAKAAGARQSPTCPCNRLMKEMNQLGIDGCRNPVNRARITAAMKKGMKGWGWGTWLKVGITAAWNGQPLTVEGMYDEAVRLEEVRLADLKK